MSIWLLAILCGVGYLLVAVPLFALVGRHLRWVRRTRTRPVEYVHRVPPSPDGGHRLRRK